MASAAPPGPDNSIAAIYLVPTGILGVIAVGLCTARIITRRRSNVGFYPDDYLNVITVTLSTVAYFISVTASIYGWGRHSYYVDKASRTKALKCLFAVVCFWIPGISFMRTTVAVALMRYNNQKWWTWTLWFVIVLQWIVPIGAAIVLFAGCRPLRSFWEPVPSVKCWDKSHTTKWSKFGIVAYTLSDILLAIMPVHLIRKLRVPRSEKIFICILMALGLLCTGIACVKIKHFGEKGDSLRITVIGSVYAKLELEIGMIAACLPVLKAPAERVLRRMGIIGEKQAVTPDLTYIAQTAPREGAYVLRSQDDPERQGSDATTVGAKGIELDPKPSPSVSSVSSEASGSRDGKGTEVKVSAV